MKLPPSKRPDAQITGIESVKKSAEAMMIFLRPNHSESVPANRDEMTDPHRTAPTIRPSWPFENVDVFSMYGYAAAQTPTSMP